MSRAALLLALVISSCRVDMFPRECANVACGFDQEGRRIFEMDQKTIVICRLNQEQEVECLP